MAAIGTLIEGKYEILTMIGKGGMSEVYLAMDKNLNKQWAVKEIKKRARDKNNAVVVQSAIAEANMMKKLDHPCLPRIVDIIDREDVIYVIMDYIEGEPLNKVLEKNGAQPQDVVIQWAEDLCGVLDYLHTQNPPIIYRDMKPANIMLQPNGNIKLIDFGIAREYKEQNLEDTVSLGTKGYAAPEQFGGKGQTDRRTDIYCLGVTLYHLVTGKSPTEPPYEIYPIRYWNPELSSGLEAIILKCTQTNPDERYDSCAELLYALSRYEDMDEDHIRKQKNKVKLFAAMLALALVSGVVGITGLAMKSQLDTNNFELNMAQAETATTSEEKVTYYQNALAVDPMAIEAYEGIVEAFKDDADFTLEEETVLKKLLATNLTELREEENYGQLAYDIGKLYWYYYSYGKTETADNQVTRIKSSMQWFQDTMTYGPNNESDRVVAEIYYNIGDFNKEVTLQVQEASDQGMYAPYFENLKKLLETVTQQENEIVNLEVYKLCMYSVETYARKLKIDGIAEADLRDFYNQVHQAIVNTDTTTDKTDAMKEDVLSRIESAELAITNAYAAE